MIIGVDDLGWALTERPAGSRLDVDHDVDHDDDDDDDDAVPPAAGAPAVDRRRRPERRKSSGDRTGSRDRRRHPVVSLESEAAPDRRGRGREPL